MFALCVFCNSSTCFSLRIGGAVAGRGKAAQNGVGSRRGLRLALWLTWGALLLLQQQLQVLYQEIVNLLLIGRICVCGERCESESEDLSERSV